MAMMIDRSGVKLAALYRPLNNFFLNFVMEHLRKKYICRNQIKKGIKGLKELLTFFKSGHSIALMIDQRVTEGINSKFFNDEAFTTTVPAQFAHKFNCNIVTVYIERKNSSDFKIIINKPIKFKKDDGIEEITRTLNSCLEEMILRNPGQWIWSHNRWKK
jgi:KDO2-lipid IV(A) lauroyltransferase